MASGDTLDRFTAQHGIPDTTNAPSIDQRGIVPVQSFDDTTDETIYIVSVLVGQYDGSSNIIFKIGAVHLTDGETGIAAEFEISLARLQDDVDDIETLDFDGAQNLTWTSADANDEITYDTLSITNANMDGIQPNEAYVIRITFDASVWGGNGGNGDVQLATLELQEA